MRFGEHFGRLWLIAGLCLMTAGCHRKTVVIPQVAQAPVPLETPPPQAKPPLVETQPLPAAPTVAVKPPRRQKKKVVPKAPAVATPAPVQVASSDTPPEAVIGALTTGGDASPERRQQAVDMIAAIDKRVKGLSADLVEHRRTQVAEVRNFLSKSQMALNSGDTSGAINLATKARLLLDDLEK